MDGPNYTKEDDGAKLRAPWFFEKFWEHHHWLIHVDVPPRALAKALLTGAQVEDRFLEMERHSLGQHNEYRHVRNIYSTIDKFSRLEPRAVKWLSLVFSVGSLLLNVYSIIYAFCVRNETAKGVRYPWAHYAVVFTEFIVICAYLGRAAKRLLSLMHVLFREAYAEWKEPGGGYKYRLQVATLLRRFWRSTSPLQFSLLQWLRQLNPLNLVEYLRVLKTKVDNREHRLEVHISAWMGGSCGTSQRLATLGAWTWAAVKLTMRLSVSVLAVVAVFLKLLQLMFLESVPLQMWSFAQALAFAQFINNLVSLDSSYQSKMAGKYEFIFFGMDAASSTDERRARAFFEQLAIMLLRQQLGSLLRALVVYNSLCSEEISEIFLEDQVDEHWRREKDLRRGLSGLRKSQRRGWKGGGDSSPGPQSPGAMAGDGGKRSTTSKRGPLACGMIRSSPSRKAPGAPLDPPPLQQQPSDGWGDVPGPRQKEDQKQRQRQQQRPCAQVYVEVDGAGPPVPAALTGLGIAAAAAAAAKAASPKPVAQAKLWRSKHPGPKPPGQEPGPMHQAARPQDMGPKGGAADGTGSGGTGGARASPYHATAYHNPYPTFSGLPALPRSRSGQLQGPLLPPPYGTGPLQSPAPAAAATAVPVVHPPKQQPRPWSAATSTHGSNASGLSGYAGGGGGPGEGGQAAGSRGANPLYGRHSTHEEFDGGCVAGVSVGWPRPPALSPSSSQQRNGWSGVYPGEAQQAMAGAGTPGALKDRYGAALNGMLDNARWD